MLASFIVPPPIAGSFAAEAELKMPLLRFKFPLVQEQSLYKLAEKMVEADIARERCLKKYGIEAAA